MYKKIFWILSIILITKSSLWAQTQKDDLLVFKDSIKSTKMDPLTPAKAAFYSAIIPGLGQAYNKKYWKIPLVYAGIGTSLYFYISNNKKYNQYRDAYKMRLEGKTNDDFPYLDDTRLIAGQRFYQRNRDLSALIAVGFYVLNIIDANVDAALLQFNVNDNLTLRPVVNPALNPTDFKFNSQYGLTLNYKF